MTFRKNGILFVIHFCTYCVIAIICIILTPIDQVGLMSFLSLPFIILAVLNPIIHNEYVTVDNKGIRCTKKGNVMWEYAWDEIIKLKRSSRYRLPSVEIVIDDHANEIAPFDHSVHYFQLGKTARKAIAQYYKSRLY